MNEHAVTPVWLHRYRLWIVLIVAAALGGCLGPGTTQSVRYYALTPVTAGQAGDSTHRRMGIMPVRLPGYLDRPALIERRGVEILPQPFSAWAAPLDREFPRVLAQNLQRAYPGSEVVVFPWRRGFAPERRLAVDVARFEIENGAALLHARWRVLGANGEGSASDAESRIQVPVAGDDDQARVAALSMALGRLSEEVALALKR